MMLVIVSWSGIVFAAYLLNIPLEGAGITKMQKVTSSFSVVIRLLAHGVGILL